MPAESPGWRRELARELTRRAQLTSAAAIDEPIGFGGAARRIGVTGPPGAGKSSLIGSLARQWTSEGERVGVLAIDPTSPVSGGSLLGDRIRMDDAAENPNLFIRSLASGRSADGLCPNVSALLDAFESARFDRLILETVGVGQVTYAARELVDTFVLVVVPESGDTIQAMKAGIMEMADIYVVNKADLPGAARMAAELRSLAHWRGQRAGRTPSIILTSATSDQGIADLAGAIDRHQAITLDPAARNRLIEARRDYHLRSTLLRRIESIIGGNVGRMGGGTLADAFHFVLARLNDAACA